MSAKVVALHPRGVGLDGRVYYPVAIGPTMRPYRLWNADEKKPMRWRCYSDLRRALTYGALAEAAWAKPGTTIEVYDASGGQLCGQFTKRVNRVDIYIPPNVVQLLGGHDA